jgi:hypothetical protein
MPGFVNNDWQSYLKGHSQHYNFNYKNSFDKVVIESHPIGVIRGDKIKFPKITPVQKQNYSKKFCRKRLTKRK